MGRADDHGWQSAASLADGHGASCAGGAGNPALVARFQDARTALNAIRGYSELMLAGGAGPLSADALEYMRQIAVAGKRLEEALAAVGDRLP